jgi:hypothetical protein
MGTLLARVKYAPRSLGMDKGEEGRSESLAAYLENKNPILCKNLLIDLAENKFAMKVSKIFVF